MGMGAAVATHLPTVPAVSALTGDVSREFNESGASRYIVVTEVSNPGDYTMGGSEEPVFARVQVDCYDASAADVDALADAVDAELNDFAGEMSGLTVQESERLDRQDLSSLTGDKARRRVRMDFGFWYSG